MIFYMKVVSIIDQKSTFAQFALMLVLRWQSPFWQVPVWYLKDWLFHRTICKMAPYGLKILKGSKEGTRSGNLTTFNWWCHVINFSLSNEYNRKRYFIRPRPEGRFYEYLVCIVLITGSELDIMKDLLLHVKLHTFCTNLL